MYYELPPAYSFKDTFWVKTYKLSFVEIENIITNPGLQHIAENILWNLDVEHLQMCGLFNHSCK